MADEKKPKERKKPIAPDADAAADKKAPPPVVAEPAAKPQTKSTKIPNSRRRTGPACRAGRRKPARRSQPAKARSELEPSKHSLRLDGPVGRP